jgi:exodeoxyribonuclease VII large subunit
MKPDWDPESIVGPLETNKEILSVSELTRMVRQCLERNFPPLWVKGEISNLRRAGSGHIYLTLKDEASHVRAVIFRPVAQTTKFELKDGLEVILFGDLTVYEPRGEYQLIIREIEPKGIGALELAFRQLKEKLEAEGLFDPARKRPLPFLPRHIGIVTSPSGAAIRDILKVIGGRFPRTHLTLYPVKVQGEGAAEEIARAIEHLNAMGGYDVLIVGRGGGSLEDLWAFNEEIVARAIAKSQIPIISAVGHEIDITISDLVADRRALTPSEAGVLVVPDEQELLSHLQELARRLQLALRVKAESARHALELVFKSYPLRRPLDLLRQSEQMADDLIQRTRRAASGIIQIKKEILNGLAARLESLSPTRVLSRGYTITTLDGENKPLKKAKGLKKGALLRTYFAKGETASRIEEIKT